MCALVFEKMVIIMEAPLDAICLIQLDVEQCVYTAFIKLGSDKRAKAVREEGHSPNEYGWCSMILIAKSGHIKLNSASRPNEARTQ